MTVERYERSIYPKFRENSAKVITTKFYEGVRRNNEWVCSREIELGTDYYSRLIDDEAPSIKYFNEAGNIIFYVETRFDRPVRFVETEYVQQNDSRIKRRRYISHLGGDVKEKFIRDSELYLMKCVSSKEEAIYEYDEN